MRIVNTTGVFPKEMDTFWIVRKMRELGYQYLDLCLAYYCNPGHPFAESGYREWAKCVKDCGDRHGITFTQCHGVGSPVEAYNDSKSIVWHTIDVAQIVGAEWIVMHPTDFRTEPVSDDYFAEMNAKYIKPFAERAGECGVKVAIENMPWPNSNRAKTLANIVDILGLPNVGVCWDTGHAHINGIPSDELRTLGHRLGTLHIHDNFGTYDDHMIPYHGNYDWTALMRILKEIDYKGDLVLETHHEPQAAMKAGNLAETERLIREMYAVSQRLLEIS